MMNLFYMLIFHIIIIYHNFIIIRCIFYITNDSHILLSFF